VKKKTKNGVLCGADTGTRRGTGADSGVRPVRERAVQAPDPTGHHRSCFCQDFRRRLQKDPLSRPLPVLGRLLSAPEVELSTLSLSLSRSRFSKSFVVDIEADVFVFFSFWVQLTWLNLHLTKIWPYVNEV